MNSFRLALWAFIAGGLIPVMAVINARLGKTLGEPIHAPVILFVIAFLTSCVIALSLTQSLPSLSTIKQASPIDFIGGMIVCSYVLSATLLAPRLGIGNFIMFAVVSQIITSAVIDNYGFFGATVREVSTLRIIGIVVLITGLVITQLAANNSPESKIGQNTDPDNAQPYQTDNKGLIEKPIQVHRET
jgi:transporter family-2 protein